MLFWKGVFMLGICIVVYNYIGYAVIAFLLTKIVPKFNQKTSGHYFPSVSFIVAAYNEEEIIEKKICNSLSQVYPSSQIEFIFITDGSTDNSMSLIEQFPTIKLLHQPERKGKSAALNRAALHAHNDILIISDANTFLNAEAVKYVASHYEDELTGGVAGEKRVIESPDDTDNVGGREGLYWRYESFLKKIDSRFYSVVGAAGELFSVRRNLYESIPDSTILDDFVISLKAAGKGYRIIYEPRAYAMEFASLSIKDEKKRKVRIAAGGFQSIKMLSSLFKFWKHPRLTFLYVSHRVLRWTLSPLCLILILISNVILALATRLPFYWIFLFLQIVFYLIALVSPFISPGSKFKFLKSCGYFVFMNASVVQGFFRFAFKKQTSAWEKVRRTSSAVSID
jgi:cellulose synthase/poly-beta-1,6-N-acetylglucosamine synthase-like glycosyltransferase